MRQIGVVTFARSDYSSCLPLLKAIQSDPDLGLDLIVSGTHLSPEFGYTIKAIEADGFEISDRVEMLLSSDTPEGVAKSVGLGIIGLAQSFARFRPNILLIVGDRVELLSVVCSALPFNIPIAHVSGGDVTEGAIDNQVRYAISKMSHIHFVAMQAHADRLVQMGEEPWRVVVSGDPALDLLQQMEFLERDGLSRSLGLKLQPPVLLITYHPTTLGSTDLVQEMESLLSALSHLPGTQVFTYPNADAQNQVIIHKIQAYVASRPGAILVSNLGQRRYYSLMAQVDLMVGNSSSGIWEAPSFRLPVVNIGERQKGRLRAGNVLDVDANADAIHSAIQRALLPSFRASLSNLQNLYGDGHATPRIVNTLKQVELNSRLLQKKFIDLPITKEILED
jgi:UDP-hydrolysing UDP-N-acetyl-D-glucosamine 2-epimerase